MSKKNGTGPGMESYDPGHYLVPARDHHGHSERVWCRIQPSIDREIDVIVQSKNWPFRVKGDFIRYAIYDTIKRLEKQKPVPNSMIVVADTILDSCRSAEMWLRFKTSLDSLEQTVKAFLDAGNEEEALKLLSTTRTHVMKLEEASWRDQYIAEFDKRWGWLWNRHKGRAVQLNKSSRTQ